jgi:hypothetical protein
VSCHRTREERGGGEGATAAERINKKGERPQKGRVIASSVCFCFVVLSNRLLVCCNEGQTFGGVGIDWYW